MKNSMLKFTIFVGLLNFMPTIFALDSKEEQLKSSKEKAINILTNAGLKKQFGDLVKLYTDIYNVQFFDEKWKALSEQVVEAEQKLCLKQEEPAIKKQIDVINHEANKLYAQSKKMYEEIAKNFPEYEQLQSLKKESLSKTGNEYYKLSRQISALTRQIDAQIPDTVKQKIQQLQDQSAQVLSKIDTLTPAETRNINAARDARSAYLNSHDSDVDVKKANRESTKLMQLSSQITEDARVLAKLLLKNSKTKSQEFVTVILDIFKRGTCLFGRDKDGELQILFSISRALRILQQER